MQIPPDRLNVYLVAVDDQSPNLVIESVAEDLQSLVLTIAQAQTLARTITTVIATATGDTT